jgi:AcrR family transcriptional regulator
LARLKANGKAGRATRAVHRREEILRGAGAVMRQRRSGRLRMQDVAARLGLVKGNIYYYFKDRQDLLYHCHVRCTEQSLEALEEVNRGGGSARARLRALLVRHVEIIVGGDFGGALLADMDTMKPPQRRRYVALRDRFESGVRNLIEEGIAGKEFRPTNVGLAGFAILGSINWTPKWYRTNGVLEPRAIAEWFADFFVEALE